eukprot:EG_transcript_1757
MVGEGDISGSSCPPAEEVDETLYSRQLYALGADAMRRLHETDVLLVGLSGLGCEVAKNLLLSGVRSLALWDDQRVQWADVSANFCLQPEDVGEDRGDRCVPRLAELNPGVDCRRCRDPLDERLVTKFHAVVFADPGPLEPLIGLNEACRQRGVAFVAVETRGVFGYVFADFGPGFVVQDVDGQEPEYHPITNITSAEEGEVTVDEDSAPALGLCAGDVVCIERVEGMPGLNGACHAVRKVTGKHSFLIGSTSDCGPYQRGGYIRQLKRPEPVAFQSLGDALSRPDFVATDHADLDRPAASHVAWRALHRWMLTHGRLPTPYDAANAAQITAIARSIDPNVPEDVVRALSFTASGTLCPMCCFFGGVAAQEVLKACTGKYRPICQWLYFDAVSCLPDCPPATVSGGTGGTRYDGQIAVFGAEFQSKLQNSNYFVVGAGALGCELLKNVALMGVGAGPRGSVTVTDMDAIEVSNLSRQFLFRRHHVGQLKSTVAAAAVRSINPAIKIRAMSHKVHEETEHLFDDRFWDRLDAVLNALDNVPARLYVDARCVSHRKPLLESGTLGPQANCQVILPFLTESYATQRDPEERAVPMCTLHFYPTTVAHTIHYAKDLFAGLFGAPAEECNRFLQDPDAYLAALERQEGVALQTLERLYGWLLAERPATPQDCLRWARQRFEELFAHQPLQLLHAHPLDEAGEDGRPFWSGSKRPPTPLLFCPTDPTHLAFVTWGARLYGHMYGLPAEGVARCDVQEVLQDTDVAPFQPRDVFIPRWEGDRAPPSATEGSPADEDAGRQQRGQALRGELRAAVARRGVENCMLTPIEFEKDDLSNGHVDFVTAASNLRARNYGIPEADKAHTRRVSGRIVPAMITTTAAITGFVCLQLYALVQGKGLPAFRNAYLNLAVPCLVQSVPRPPPRLPYLPASDPVPTTDPADPLAGRTFTLWDRLELAVNTDVALPQLLAAFQKKFGMTVVMMSCGATLVYGPSVTLPAAASHLPLSVLLQRLFHVPVQPRARHIDFVVSCD